MRNDKRRWILLTGKNNNKHKTLCQLSALDGEAMGGRKKKKKF